MTTSNRNRRRLLNFLVILCSSLAAVGGLLILIWILSDVFLKGISAINWNFFLELPAPPGEKITGLGNAILGTLVMTSVAALIAIPFGVLAGTYLAEFSYNNRFSHIVRYVSDILVSAPSIVIGVFVYLILVRPTAQFSGLAGSLSLAIIMIPVVTRTSEEMLRLVPVEMREAALALGVPYWKIMFTVIYRAAATGMLTGILLSVARVAGETAPLLFTALNSPYWMESLNEPIANLTVTLFNYAMSPYEDWNALAWGAALIITLGVLSTTILSRLVLLYRKK